jgi:hypothetical protein
MANSKPDECDFCSSHQVVRRYQCMDFEAESKSAGVLYVEPEATSPTNVVLRSIDYWAACAECSRYVDAEDIEGLLKHVDLALDSQRRLSPSKREAFLAHTRHAYTLFFRNRIRVVAE